MTELLSQPAGCVLCGSRGAALLFTPQPGDTQALAQYPFVRCATCGLIYVASPPTWDERMLYYATDYRGYHRLEIEPSALTRRAMQYGLQRRYQLVARYQPAGRLLDIGCSGGDFAHWMAQQPGWQAYGLERVPAMAQSARERYALPTLIGDAMQVGLASEQWDVLTLWTVLEHMLNPVAGVRECNRLLRPGGTLVVQTVSAESLAARWFGRHWLGYDTPRILYVFSRATLRRLLRANGFEPLWVGCYFHDYYPLLWSWRSFCDAKIRAGQGKEKPYEWVAAMARTGVARLLSYPFLRALTFLGKSSFLVAIARKVGG